MNGIAYWAPPDENTNFISRPTDPGPIDLFKTVGWEALYHSPFYATRRFSELTLEKVGSPNFPSRILDPVEATQKYGLDGQLKFDEPIREEAAQLMYRRKIDENDRAYLIQSGQTTGMRKVGSFAVGMAASLLDPINFAAMFIPVAGEARIARIAQSVGGSTLRQRIAQGALTGLSGAAMVEPFILLPALQEQANYNLKDSALNLGFGAALGGMLHAGLGAVQDRISRLAPKDADVIFETAMNDVLQDQPVVSPAKVESFTESLEQQVYSPMHDPYAGQRPEITLTQPEHIASAAYRLEDGTILTGKSHPLIIMEHGDAPLVGATDGFLTSKGRFVSREEASNVAVRAGQIDANPESPYQGSLSTETANIGFKWSETFELHEQRQDFLAKQDLDAAGIPRRDARGKFLSKEARLQMLDQKLQEEAVAKARAEQESRTKNIHKETQENISRLPEDDKGMTGVTAKDTESIMSEVAEIEKALDMTPEEKTRFRESIKEEAGDQPGRERGIVEGIKCIIRNLK